MRNACFIISAHPQLAKPNPKNAEASSGTLVSITSAHPQLAKPDRWGGAGERDDLSFILNPVSLNLILNPRRPGHALNASGQGPGGFFICSYCCYHVRHALPLGGRRPPPLATILFFLLLSCSPYPTFSRPSAASACHHYCLAR